MDNTVYKGFINDWAGRTLLPITRGELVLDSNGIIALQSDQFLAKDGHPGLVTSAERALISSLTSAGGALEQVADFEQRLYEFMDTRRFGVLEAIRTTGKLEPETENAIKAALTELVAKF